MDGPALRAQHQRLGTPGQPTTATNDNWLPAHIGADGAAHGPYTMSYYERQDIPFHFALAETFTLCDAYYCSLLGPTWPNRMYLMTGMIDPNGTGGGPIISNVVPSPVTHQPYTWTTYPERLTQAGISWRVYQEEDDYGTNPLEWFQAFQSAKPGSTLYENGLTIHSADRFEWDAAQRQAPHRLVDPPHLRPDPSIPPISPPRAPTSWPPSSTRWPRTATRGQRPSTSSTTTRTTACLTTSSRRCRPAGTPDEFVDGLPIGGGVRVPCLVVSPWSIGGFVATEQFDHTSVLQFLETLTGVSEPNISAWRRQAFGDLTSALGFTNGRRSSSPPHLPPTIGEFWEAEEEVATLPAAAIPGAAQTPPVQEKHRPRLPWTPQPSDRRERRGQRAMPATKSRFEENRTTHAADFKRGATDRVYLSKISAVEGKHVVPSASESMAYVPGIVGGSVAIFSGSAMTLASAVKGSTTNPYGVAATPDGSQVWVTESGTNTVSVIPTSTNQITSTVVVGIYPHGIAITPDGPRRLRRQHRAQHRSRGIPDGLGGGRQGPDPDRDDQRRRGAAGGGYLPQRLAGVGDLRRRRVRHHHRQRSVPARCPSRCTAPRSGGHARRQARLRHRHRARRGGGAEHLHVAHGGPGRASAARRGTRRSRADSATAYVSNANEDTVSAIDTARGRVTNTIALGAGGSGQINHIPTGIALSPEGHIWVACNVSSSIVVIDPSSNAVIQSDRDRAR